MEVGCVFWGGGEGFWGRGGCGEREVMGEEEKGFGSVVFGWWDAGCSCHVNFWMLWIGVSTGTLVAVVTTQESVFGLNRSL